MLLEKTPASRFAPRATLNLGRIYELRDFAGDQINLGLAIRYYQNVIDQWPDKPIASEAVLRLGSAYIHLAWLGLSDMSLWIAFPISVVWVIVVIRWG